jgi:hypothetical protein
MGVPYPKVPVTEGDLKRGPLHCFYPSQAIQSSLIAC